MMMVSQNVTDSHRNLILTPFKDGTPGPYLRYDSVYDVIRHARLEDNHRLSRGVWQVDLKKAEHDVVEKVCLDVLSNRSKDLQILGWLIEAWFMLRDLEGLNEGLSLMSSFSRTFWEIMHPQDAEHRALFFEWFDETVAVKLNLLSLTQVQGVARQYHLHDYLNALRLEKEIKRSDTSGAQKLLDNAKKRGEPTQAQFKEAFNQTSKDYKKKRVLQLNFLNDRVKELKNNLGDKLGKESPSFSKTLSVAGQILQLIVDPRDNAQEVVSPLPSGKSWETDSSSLASLQPSQGSALTAPVLTDAQKSLHDIPRAQAYEQLRTLAFVFETIEPHSPTANILKKVAAWETMQLSEILNTFAKSGDAMALFLNLIAKEK